MAKVPKDTASALAVAQVPITILPPGQAAGASDLRNWATNRNAGRSGSAISKSVRALILKCKRCGHQVEIEQIPERVVLHCRVCGAVGRRNVAVLRALVAKPPRTDTKGTKLVTGSDQIQPGKEKPAPSLGAAILIKSTDLIGPGGFHRAAKEIAKKFADAAEAKRAKQRRRQQQKKLLKLKRLSPPT
jgi:hypothetical protein